MRAGERLRAWREEQGWTQGEVARRIEVDQAAVSKWERGVVSPGLKAAIGIAKISRGRVPVGAWTEEAKPTGTAE